jgi:ferric-dicitrate binding protein FerR (iron transport regulator)
MSLQEAQQFVAHFIKGEYAPGDYAAFLRWLKEATVEELNAIADTHESLHGSWSLSDGPSAEWVAQLEQKLDRAIGEQSEQGEEMTPVIRMRPGGFGRRNVWVAAASIVILLSTGTFIYLRKGGSGSAAAELQSREKALSRVFSNPRGGAIKELVLDDGSKVWLNAASTLKYPSGFSGPERLVELSGEAFFEVAGNSNSPFRVLIRDAEVEVLGTHFNIMAYDDEPISRTTLVDGAVKIKSGGENATLQPGQQAEMTYSSPGAVVEIHVQSGIDPKKALGWKDGSFDFANTDLQTIMRVVSRTYNVDVQYEANVPNRKSNVGFNRADGLNKVLKNLENLFNIRFKIDGKTVIVTPI